MKRIALMVLVSAMFTGCASSNGNIVSGEPSIGAIIACRAGVCSEEVVQWKNTRMLNSAKSQCNSMGFQAGTVPYSQCIQNIVISARQQEALERAASDASHAQFMNNLQQPIQPGAIQSNRSINYDCRERLGGRIECTGY
jgi:hypothetical protein